MNRLRFSTLLALLIGFILIGLALWFAWMQSTGGMLGG